MPVCRFAGEGIWLRQESLKVGFILNTLIDFEPV